MKSQENDKCIPNLKTIQGSKKENTSPKKKNKECYGWERHTLVTEELLLFLFHSKGYCLSSDASLDMTHP